MSKFIISILLLVFTQALFAVDVGSRTNSDNCAGALLSFFNRDSKYTSYKNLPEVMPEKLKGNLYSESGQISKFSKYRRAFFSSLVSKEIDEKNLAKALSKLNQSDLKGCFVVKEVTYYQGFTQLNLLFNKDFSRRQQIEFGILSDDSNKTYEMAFALFENNKILGTSYLYSVEAR